MSTERFEKLANSKFDSKVAQLNLLERVDAQLAFTHNGGLFKATPELMSIVTFYSETAEGERVLILDEYQNPILVELDTMIQLIVTHHQFALNAYHNDYTELKGVRNGDKI
jgi:hypothetical protein